RLSQEDGSAGPCMQAERSDPLYPLEKPRPYAISGVVGNPIGTWSNLLISPSRLMSRYLMSPPRVSKPLKFWVGELRTSSSSTNKRSAIYPHRCEVECPLRYNQGSA